MGRTRKRARAELAVEAPRTAAGNQIVDAVLDASELLLERDGIGGLNTNAAAKRAGVSVGSVYQYFRDKHAIAAALTRRLELRGLTLFVTRMQELGSAGVRQAAWELVGVLLDPALGGLGFRRALLAEVPRGWLHDATAVTDGAVEQLIAAFLSAHDEEVRAGAHELMAFVVMHAVEGVIEAVLLEAPELIASPLLRDELHQLVWRYVADDDEESRALVAPGAAPPTIGADLAGRLSREPSPCAEIAARPRARNARGQGTVDNILAAARTLLCRDGYDGIGIRAIAREASLAPSALYRHFPGKEAVVAELARRLERRSADEVARRAASLPASGARATEMMVQLFASGELDEPDLRRALLLHVPRSWVSEAAAHKNAAIQRIVRAELAARSDEVRSCDLNLATFVVARAVKAVVDSALVLRPDWMGQYDLAQETARLAWRYLRCPR